MILGLAALLLFVLASATLASGPPRVSVSTMASQKLPLTVGKSIIVESADAIKRVSVAAPDIADTVILTSRQIYVTGKASGVTTLTLWSDANRISAVFDVEVIPDVAALKEKIHQMFPGEDGVKAVATHDSITLSGTVSGAGKPHPDREAGRGLCAAGQDHRQTQDPEPARGRRRPAGHAGGPRLRDVPQPDEEAGRQLQLYQQRGNNFGISLLNSLTKLPAAGWPGNPLNVTDNVNWIFRFARRQRHLDDVHRCPEGKRADENPCRADAHHPERPLREFPGRRRVSHPRSAGVGWGDDHHDRVQDLRCGPQLHARPCWATARSA